jgi:carbon storage regulator
MLVLTRKLGERIVIGEDISLVILEVRPQRIRIGLEAPPNVSIMRAELQERRDSTLSARSLTSEDLVHAASNS